MGCEWGKSGDHDYYKRGKEKKRKDVQLSFMSDLIPSKQFKVEN